MLLYHHYQHDIIFKDAHSMSCFHWGLNKLNYFTGSICCPFDVMWWQGYIGLASIIYIYIYVYYEKSWRFSLCWCSLTTESCLKLFFRLILKEHHVHVKFESSANNIAWNVLLVLCISFMYMVNRGRSETEPSGTPEVTDIIDEFHLCHDIHFFIRLYHIRY